MVAHLDRARLRRAGTARRPLLTAAEPTSRRRDLIPRQAAATRRPDRAIHRRVPIQVRPLLRRDLIQRLQRQDTVPLRHAVRAVGAALLTAVVAGLHTAA